MSAMQLVNTSQEEIVLPFRTYMRGSILPARGKLPYAARVIDDKTDFEIHYVEYDWTKAKRIPIPIAAADICADFMVTEKLKEKGCFAKPVGEEITTADIKQAQENRRNWLQGLVEAGDEEYLRSKRVDQIPTMCKRAVRELGVKREWAVTAPNPTVQCEACAGRVEMLDSGKAPILCTFCSYPLDKERAIEEGLWTPPVKAKPAAQPSPPAKEK